MKTLIKSNYTIKFGTDGWRGVIARDFTFANLRRVARGLVNFILEQKKTRDIGTTEIVIGYDRRFLSKDFASEFARVVSSCGARTILSREEITTPMLSYAAKKHKAFLGVMITASHNPPEYNGIKFKSSDGASAKPELTSLIEKLIPPDADNSRRSPGFCGGKSDNQPIPADLKKTYTSKLRKSVGEFAFSGTAGKNPPRRRIKIIFDPMHGSGAGGVFENLISGFGQFEVVEINSSRDPLFGGINPEPIKKNLSALAGEVVRQKAAAGIAIDGDGDRIGVVDDRGRYLPPHTLFPVFLEYLITGNPDITRNGCAVQGVAMGYLSERIADFYGIKIKEVPVGFKYLAEELIGNKKCFIGAEESGGIGFGSFMDYIPERDGLAAAMFLGAIIQHSDLPLSAIADNIYKRFGFSFYERYDLHFPSENPVIPDREKIYSAVKKFFAGDKKTSVSFIDGIKIRFKKDNSWLLVRPSGTEPLVRIYSETPDAKYTSRLIEKARRIISQILPDAINTVKD